MTLLVMTEIKGNLENAATHCDITTCFSTVQTEAMILKFWLHLSHKRSYLDTVVSIDHMVYGLKE